MAGKGGGEKGLAGSCRKIRNHGGHAPGQTELSGLPSPSIKTSEESLRPLSSFQQPTHRPRLLRRSSNGHIAVELRSNRSWNHRLKPTPVNDQLLLAYDGTGRGLLGTNSNSNRF